MNKKLPTIEQLYEIIFIVSFANSEQSDDSF